jgi:uncharacterized protein YjdB
VSDEDASALAAPTRGGEPVPASNRPSSQWLVDVLRGEFYVPVVRLSSGTAREQPRLVIGCHQPNAREPLSTAPRFGARLRELRVIGWPMRTQGGSHGLRFASERDDEHSRLFRPSTKSHFFCREIAMKRIRTVRLRGAAGVLLLASLAIGAALYAFHAPDSTTQERVGAPRIVAIRLTPVAPKLAVGSSQGMTATGTLSDGTKQNVTTKLTWTSTATAVAIVTDPGELKAMSPGQTTIRAAFGDVSSVITLTVSAN